MLISSIRSCARRLARRAPPALRFRRSLAAGAAKEHAATRAPPVFRREGSRVVFDAPPVSIPRTLARRLLLGATGAAAAAAGLVYVADEGLWRTATVASALVPMFVDYQRVAYRVSHLPEELQKPHFDEYHEKWAHEPLRVCLALRGFYVKIGQIMAGAPDVLPKPYAQSLKVLQEDVPPQPFETIRAIVESELGCPLEDAFETFSETPLGAASIGQVHLATLPGGSRPVIVKVQYPETERFFRLDFATIKRIMGAVTPDMIPVLDEMEGCFEQEFDYTREGANLRRMVKEVQPHFAGVSFPEPYDLEHPGLPADLRARGMSLVTKRVLTMDLCAGKSVTKIGRRMLEQFAESRGVTPAALEEEMKEKMKDPEEFEKLLASVPSPAQLAAYRAFLLGRDYLRNVVALGFNWTLGWLGATLPVQWTTIPPNGPALLRRLYEIHGFEIFEVGAFNADPHAGNVMLDEATGSLALIDYGQLIALTPAERASLARMVVAADEGDGVGVSAEFTAGGTVMRDLRHPEQGVNPPGLCLAVVGLHFGGAEGIRTGMQYLGCSSLAELQGRMAELVKIERPAPVAYTMMQRCSFCLQGVGAGVGLPGANALPLLRPSAERYLARHAHSTAPDSTLPSSTEL